MYYFIVNPHSRSGKGEKIWGELEPLLIEKKVDYKVFFTKHNGHGTKITKDITSTDLSRNIIVLGGDGTVNEVINGIQDFEKVTFGYIPTGSSNDFARGLSLPVKPKEALETILSPKQMTNIDIGALRYENETRYFGVSSGMGFDASICHAAFDSKLKRTLNRLKLGKLTYVAIALQQLSLFTPKKMTITVDGEKTHSFEKVYFTAVMNLPYEGGGLMLTPDAKANDRKLHVCVIEGYSKPLVLHLLPKAFFGKHINSKGVHIYPCEKVTLTADSKLAVHTDGESCQLQTSIEATCATKALPVITG